MSVDEWAEKKWRWDARLKSEDGYLTVEQFGKDFDKVMAKLGVSGVKDLMDILKQVRDDFHEIYHEIKEEQNFEEIRSYFKNNPWLFYEFVRGYHQDRKAMTQFFQSLGYKGIIDQEGCCVYGGEPQIIVFDPKNIEWGERHENIPGEEYVL